MLGTKLESELICQRERAVQIREITHTPHHIVERYRYHRLWRLSPKEFVLKSFGDLKDKKVPDFGSREGRIATQMALLGARVTGSRSHPRVFNWPADVRN